MSRLRVLLGLFVAGEFSLLLADTVNEVQVIGRRSGQSQMLRSGQSLQLYPRNPGDHGVQDLLREQAVVDQRRSGGDLDQRSVPSIRGFPSRYVEVFLDDTPLINSTTSLPLPPHFSLHGFGGVTLHQGITPASVPTLSPAGAVQYRLLSPNQRERTLTGTLGEPEQARLRFDSAGRWPPRAGPDDHQLSFRQALSWSTGTGRHSYFDNNQTPETASDDKDRIRENNDHRRYLLQPWIKWRQGDNEVRLIAWRGAATYGMPASPSSGPSFSRLQTHDQAALLRFRRSLAHTFWEQASLQVGRVDQQRDLDDPDRQLLVRDPRQEIGVETWRGQLALQGHHQGWSVYATSRVQSTQIRTQSPSSELNATRQSAHQYLGAKYENSLLESTLKASWRQVRDDVDQQTVALGETPQPETGLVEGSEIAFVQGLKLGPLRLYGQSGVSLHPPGIVARYGDGARIREQPNIAEERIRHREVGVVVKPGSKDWQIALAAFSGDIENQIVFTPAVGQSLRAQNARESRLRGTTTRGQTCFADLCATAEWVWIEALVTSLTPNRQVPGIAKNRVGAGLTFEKGGLYAASHSRYRSRIFRDLGNQRELPGAWRHDLTLGWKPEPRRPYGLFLHVKNLLNTAQTELTSDGRTGYVAVADQEGQPLPGRTWSLSGAWHF